MPPPLQPSPRSTQAIQSLITKMEDDAREQEDPLHHGVGVHGPPSNREIEQVIKSAMALAGSKAGLMPREGLASRASSPGLAGREESPLMGFSGYEQMQHPTQYAINSRLGMPQTRELEHGYHQPMYSGYLQPQPHHGIPPLGMGMGPAPSMGFGGMQHHHAHVKPVSLPMFKPRPHTPIMFHPAAVGVDGRVNLFVGNLPYRVRWQDLKDLFRRAGTVLRADVSLDPQSNRSRGHGTVLMGSQEDGIKAIELFNGYNWQTRILEVRPDRLPPEYEPHPYVPTSAFGPAPVGGYGNASRYTGNTARLDSGRGFVPNNGGLGVGPALGAGSRYSPAPSHLSPLGNHTTPGMPARMAVARSISPFGEMSDDFPAERNYGVSPSASQVVARNAQYSPQSNLPERDRSRSPSEVERRTSFVDSTSPNARRAAPVGLAFDNGQREMEIFNSGKGYSPFGMVQGAHGPSLSRSVLQGNLSSAFPNATTLLDIPRNQKRPAPPVRQDTLGGRLLYVENLPPTMQWQELKDLFRMSGGTVIRADIAQGSEHRNRGYGTVLFASEMDAIAAVERYDGADYQGRQLQVRQDKTQSGPIPALTPTERAVPLQFPEKAEGAEQVEDKPSPQGGNGARPTGLAGKRGNLPPLRLGPGPNGYGMFNAATVNGHPGRMMMPNNVMSPGVGRGMAPMTPSMPGFTFHAYPSTPPMMPMGFLSPGLGPFSPALNSPQSFVFNPFMNAAPGAPLNMTPTGPMPPNMNAPYAMTPGHPLTVDPTSQHHPAHPDYFPPQDPISHGPPGYMGVSGSVHGNQTEERSTPRGPDGEAEVTASLSQLGLNETDPVVGSTGFSSRASFASTRPEGLSAGMLVDRDRRASMNDAAQFSGFPKMEEV